MTTEPPRTTDVATAAGPIPVLAVVGRPNVGKSTLVNRMIGRREAVVQDVPGVTRDRVSYDANWNGRAFTVVDTGGWDPDARGLAEAIRAQAEIAVTIADAVLFVVDATVGITDADESVVKVLRKSGKPVVLAANKVDDQRTEAEAFALWNLGLGEPYPVSALHGRGSGDMLDAILAALPEPPPESLGATGGPRRVAIVGKPNVGKSSLLNKLAKADRVVVDDVAGTTVDPVDELVQLGGRTWRFIDTAGIRKRVKEASGHEYYASLRTTGAIERAEVCVLVVDASQVGGEPKQGAILAAITALKQICNHPAAYQKGYDRPLAGRSGKLSRLEEIVETVFAAGERILVFTHFAEWGMRLADHLTQVTGVGISCYHGGLARGARDRMVGEFQALDGPGALVLSLKAGGTGLNLTGANHVVLYDRWWNPAVEDQARDRAWRIGQTKTVISHRLVCPGTVDERVEEVVAGKRHIADLVLPKSSSMSDLDPDQLRAALGLRPETLLTEEDT